MTEINNQDQLTQTNIEAEANHPSFKQKLAAVALSAMAVAGIAAGSELAGKNKEDHGVVQVETDTPPVPQEVEVQTIGEQVVLEEKVEKPAEAPTTPAAETSNEGTTEYVVPTEEAPKEEEKDVEPPHEFVLDEEMNPITEDQPQEPAPTELPEVPLEPTPEPTPEVTPNEPVNPEIQK